MKVDRASAALLGVQVDLPELAERVGLDEVPLVVHVELVIDRMILELGHVTGDVDDGHSAGECRRAAGRDRHATVRCSWTAPSCSRFSARPSTPSRARSASSSDWGLAGTRPGQYRSDLVADAAAVARPYERRTRGAERGVRAERAGSSDGRCWRCSTRSTARRTPHGASRGSPRASACSTRMGPLAATGRQPGDGRPLRGRPRRGAHGATASRSRRRGVESLRRSIIGLSGYPPRYLGWRQYRSLGAAALDLCAVADGTLDGYVDCMPRRARQLGLPRRPARVHRGGCPRRRRRGP